MGITSTRIASAPAATAPIASTAIRTGFFTTQKTSAGAVFGRHANCLSIRQNLSSNHKTGRHMMRASNNGRMTNQLLRVRTWRTPCWACCRYWPAAHRCALAQTRAHRRPRRVANWRRSWSLRHDAGIAEQGPISVTALTRRTWTPRVSRTSPTSCASRPELPSTTPAPTTSRSAVSRHRGAGTTGIYIDTRRSRCAGWRSIRMTRCPSRSISTVSRCCAGRRARCSVPGRKAAPCATSPRRQV